MPVYTMPEHVWTVDEMANASLLNQYHRDNMAATLHRLAYKTADESLASSNALQNDDHLFIDVAANQTWYYRLLLWCSQPTVSVSACNIALAFTFPSGSLNLECWTDLIGVIPGRTEWTTSGLNRNLKAYSGSPTTRTLHVVEGVFLNSTTPITFRVQWAQNTSDAGALYVYKGSTLWGANIT
jgi:hypothetical protein